jgi:hypothetical protein
MTLFAIETRFNKVRRWTVLVARAVPTKRMALDDARGETAAFGVWTAFAAL